MILSNETYEEMVKRYKNEIINKARQMPQQSQKQQMPKAARYIPASSQQTISDSAFTT